MKSSGSLSPKNLKRVFGILLAAFVLALLVLPAYEVFGDLGNFAGKSNYGGSKGSSWEDFDFDIMTWVIAIVLVIVLFVYYMLKDLCLSIWRFITGKKPETDTQSDEPVETKIEKKETLHPMADYQKLDPNFDEAMFKAWIAKVYVQLLEALHEKDIAPVRPFLTEKLFDWLTGKAEQLKEQHRTSYTENIAVLGVDLLGFEQKDGMDCITTKVTTRIINYTLDDDTGKLVSGDKTAEKFMEYGWQLVRKTGIVTPAKGEQVRAATCPNCGAPLDKNASMKCPYCESVLPAASEDWIISYMQDVSCKS